MINPDLQLKSQHLLRAQRRPSEPAGNSPDQPTDPQEAYSPTRHNCTEVARGALKQFFVASYNMENLYNPAPAKTAPDLDYLHVGMPMAEFKWTYSGAGNLLDTPLQAVVARELSPQFDARFEEVKASDHWPLASSVTFPGWRNIQPEKS